MGIILLSFWLLTGYSLITSGFTAGDEGTSTGEKVMKKKEKTAAEILEAIQTGDGENGRLSLGVEWGTADGHSR